MIDFLYQSIMQMICDILLLILYRQRTFPTIVHLFVHIQNKGLYVSHVKILYSLNIINIMKCFWLVINSYMIISLLVLSVVVVLSIQYILFLLHTLSFSVTWGASSTNQNNKHQMKSDNAYEILGCLRWSICCSEYDGKIIDFILFFNFFWEMHKILFTSHSSWSTCCTAYMRMPHYSFILFSFDFKNCSQPENVKLERFDLHFII